MSDHDDEAHRRLEAANTQLAAAQNLTRTLLWILLWIIIGSFVFWTMPTLFTGIGQIVSGITGIISPL